MKRSAGRNTLSVNAMDHKLAAETNTVEKYILNELTGAERLAFEEHLFDCAICAGQVKLDSIVIGNLKQVLLEERTKPVASRPPARAKLDLFGWLRPMTLVPTFAALALAVIVGYQNFVYIPGLTRPQVLETAPIFPVTRDAAPVVTETKAPVFAISFDVDSPQSYASYTCEFQLDGKGTVLEIGSGPRKTKEFTLNLLLPAKQFPPGRYTMILRAAVDNQVEIARYAFVIQK
jgi:hypothetical protein